MGFFSRKKIDDDEILKCLAYYKSSMEIVAFQTKEADLQNNEMVKYSNSILEDPNIARKALKAKKRLVLAAEEIIRRHEELRDVPNSAVSLHHALSLTYTTYLAWAKAAYAAIEAIVEGNTPNSTYVQHLLEELQKSVNIEHDEEEKFLKQLKSKASEILKISARSASYGLLDTWEPPSE